MITKIVSADKIANQYASEVRLVGLSTDAKPVDVTNATEFEEMDTGDVYIFDADGAQWLKKKDNVGGGLPHVTKSDAGKVATVDNSGAWGASINQVEIFADYDPANEFFTQRSGADVPTANELNTAFTRNGAVRMRIFVNDNEVGYVYLYPFGDESGGLLFGTVVRNRNVDYDESINVLFSVNDDDVVAFTVDKSLTPKGRFIVTLTPTTADFSGTMDKTALEITNAYNAGKDIEFDIPSLSVRCKGMEFAGSGGRVAVGAIVTYRANGAHMLIEILTNNGSDFATTYQTTIYSLTPAT